MKYYGYGIAGFSFSLVIMLVLSIGYGYAAEPEKAGPPKAAISQEGTKETKAGEDETAKYAVCSPVFSAQEIAALMEFVKGLAPDIVPQLDAILLKCDFAANEDLLQLIAGFKSQLEQCEFANPEDKTLFKQEKVKELQVQMALSEPTINENKIKILVGELFNIRQETLERTATYLKKRIAERQKLKEQIVEQKVKDLVRGAKPAAGEKLMWD